jgi:glycosyltransferase involved in cell wall biosynthesis
LTTELSRKGKVLSITYGHGGCEFYRTFIPYTELRSHGWVADWIPVEKIDKILEVFGWGQYDLVQLSRVGTWSKIEFAPAIKMVNELGARMVYECDDDLTNEHRKVVSYNIGDIVSLCDSVIVSTPHLAKVMQRYGKPVYVAQNYVNMRHFAERARVVEGLTIGLSGSKTHEEDWKVIAEPLKRIASEYEVHVIVGGYCPKYLESVPGIKLIEGLPYKDYPAMIRQFDIGLCPVNDDPFNLSKSGIKAMELMASQRRVGDKWGGAAVIASKHLIYNQTVNHNNTGLLVPYDEESWYQAIKSLVTDEAKRQRLQVTGHKWVAQNRSIAVGWKEWGKAFAQIMR